MISIIVPVYNIEKYIDKCIESIVNQTYKDLEILLIDDGSIDNSYELCGKWANQDSRIRLIHKENEGVSKTRNLGLELAKGEYIFFLDGDDWIDQNCLEDMMNIFNENKDVEIVSTDYQLELEEGCNHEEFHRTSNYGLVNKELLIEDFYNFKLYTITIWGKLYRKDLWENIRFKQLKYSEDTYAMFEIIEKTNSLYQLNSCHYHYLQRNNGASHQLNQNYYKDMLITYNYRFEVARFKYDQYIEKSAKEYIDMSYALLKIYQKNSLKIEAYHLIDKMKEIYKISKINSNKFSYKVLTCHKNVIYFLISIKNIISK